MSFTLKLDVAVIITIKLLVTRDLLYLRPLPGLLQDGPQLAVLALGVLGLVPSKSDSESAVKISVQSMIPHLLSVI